MDIDYLKDELRRLANPEKAKIFGRFFKTGKGEYGEGDKFLGIMTGPIGELARKYKDLSFPDLQMLLNGVYHEERSLGHSNSCQTIRKRGNKKEEENCSILFK